MEISIRRKQGVAILDLCGRIDIDSAIFVETVGYLLRNGESDILCNLEDVDFIDYTGVSVIAVAYKEVMNNNGRMRFCSIPAHLKGIFFVSGLERSFEIFASEDAALNSFKEDRIIEKIKKEPLRRRFKRLPIKIKIEYKLANSPQNIFFEGEIIDLSAVGAYIIGNKRFALNEILNIKMNLSPKPGRVSVLARVVWHSDKQIQPQYHPGMGVEFYNLSSYTQKKILEFIDRNLAFSSTTDI